MIERSASFPTRFMSSPCPAMPTTSVEKISGTISSLIIRRKIVDSTLSDAAWNTGVGCPGTASGNATPTMTPTTIEMKIQCVSVRRRKIPPPFAGAGELLTRHRRLAAAQRGVPVAVEEIEDQPYHQPDAESLPRLLRQPPHDEKAQRGAERSHEPQEGDAKGARAIRFSKAKNHN